MGGDGVFISSTCYDLIDARAELRDALRDLGLIVRVSDDALSDFEVQPASDSIETCLANVRSSAVFICILSQRYGPRLGKVGYENISATHLEYRAAIAAGLEIHFYARDRLIGDHAVWKKNPNDPNLKLAWVDRKDFGLFEFLDERATLRAGESKNWYWPFRDSTDLKLIVARAVHRQSRRAILGRLLERGGLPFPAPDHPGVGRTGLKCNAQIQWRNVGEKPAINFTVRIERPNRSQQSITLFPEKNVTTSFEFDHVDLPYGTEILTEYSTQGGHVLQDEFLFTALDVGNAKIEHVAKRMLDSPSFRVE